MDLASQKLSVNTMKSPYKQAYYLSKLISTKKALPVKSIQSFQWSTAWHQYKRALKHKNWRSKWQKGLWRRRPHWWRFCCWCRWWPGRWLSRWTRCWGWRASGWLGSRTRSQSPRLCRPRTRRSVKKKSVIPNSKDHNITTYFTVSYSRSCSIIEWKSSNNTFLNRD